jgi:hypothetical protein
MKDLLQEIKMLQGVVGVFVYSSNLGVIAMDVPPTFSEPALDRIGSFVKVFFGNQTTQAQDVMSLEVKNKESLFLYKKIDDGGTLITICDVNVSMPLVNMTTSMLLAELKAAADLITVKPSFAELNTVSVKPVPVAAPAQGAGVAHASAAAPVPSSAIDVDKLMKEGPFAAISSKLEDAMARAIGPIGSMIVRDCVVKWVEGGSPSKSRFNELLGLLVKEIGDSQLEAEFKKEVGSLFS